jgi:hypothetical protein
VPIREMSESELDEVYRSFERVGVTLTPADKAALKLEVWEIAENARWIWYLWEKTPLQQQKEMRAVADLARSLEKALGKPPEGDWLGSKPIVQLVHHLADVYSQSGRGGIYPDDFEKALRSFYGLLCDVAIAAEMALELEPWERPTFRGRDEAVILLLGKLSDIWGARTKGKADAWVDSATGEYRGNFWYFIRASAVLCREFMGEKASDGALFSRLERLIREVKNSPSGPLPTWPRVRTRQSE